jgi:hypothetical protein
LIERLISAQVLYGAMHKTAVIALAPHIPFIETDERACYAILLLHTEWIDGEANLLRGAPSAMARYNAIKADNSLPDYVIRSVSRRAESDALLADTGTADYMVAPATVEEFSELFADETEEIEKTQSLPLDIDAVPDSTTPQGFKNRVLTSCPASYLSFLHQFVPNMRKAKRDGHISNNQCNEDELKLKASNMAAIVSINDIDAARDELDASVASLNSEQRRVFDEATYHISGEHGGQMFMFLSGEGGVGKSRIISDVTKYTQILYGKTLGYFGSVVKTAPTGGAAFNIKGHTWHSALGKSGIGRHTQKTQLSDKAICTLKKNLNGAVLFVLDEISLLSLEDLSEISFRLCTATGNFNKPFGGLHTILAGDFYQMKTISGTPIVTTNPRGPEARDGRSIWLKLTHFAQLTINVRAQANHGILSPLAEFTKRVRVGDVGPGVLDAMNTRVVNSMAVAMRLAHPQAVWISATHKRIKHINEQFLTMMQADGKQVVRLIAVHHPSKVSTPRPNRAIRQLLYNVGGAATNRSGVDTQMVTHMDVCIGTRIRIVSNILTECGLFNGAMGTIWGFVYQGRGPQTAAEYMPTDFGTLEDSERELPVVLVQMDGFDDPNDPTKSSFPYSCHDTVPRIVPLVPVSNNARLKVGDGKYTRFMVPFVPAHGRTGHSIQGYTAIHGVVDDVGSPFFAGEYVALSRATNMESIFLLSPLMERYFTSQPEYRILIHLEYERLLKLYNQDNFRKVPRKKNNSTTATTEDIDEFEDVQMMDPITSSLVDMSLRYPRSQPAPVAAKLSKKKIICLTDDNTSDNVSGDPPIDTILSLQSLSGAFPQKKRKDKTKSQSTVVSAVSAAGNIYADNSSNRHSGRARAPRQLIDM